MAEEKFVGDLLRLAELASPKEVPLLMARLDSALRLQELLQSAIRKHRIEAHPKHAQAASA
jgi:hypothetical protein